MVICPDCGREVPEDKFCKNCGAFLPKIEEAQPIEAVEDNSLQTNLPANVEEVNVSSQRFNYCVNCGFKLADDYKFCPNCGYNLKAPVRSNNVSINQEKNMLVTIILSVFLPGLGQMYLGLDHKGAILLLAYIVSAILILLVIGLFLVMIIWIWALVDAIISCNALNRGEEIEDKLF